MWESLLAVSQALPKWLQRPDRDAEEIADHLGLKQMGLFASPELTAYPHDHLNLERWFG